MNTEQVAKKVVELVRKQAWYEALDTLYDDNVVSVEAYSAGGGSPGFRRTAAGAVCFHADDVVIVKCVERFVPRLFANQFHDLFCNLFSVHVSLLAFVLLADKFVQEFNRMEPRG